MNTDGPAESGSCQLEAQQGASWHMARRSILIADRVVEIVRAVSLLAYDTSPIFGAHAPASSFDCLFNYLLR